MATCNVLFVAISSLVFNVKEISAILCCMCKLYSWFNCIIVESLESLLLCLLLLLLLLYAHTQRPVPGCLNSLVEYERRQYDIMAPIGLSFGIFQVRTQFVRTLFPAS